MRILTLAIVFLCLPPCLLSQQPVAPPGLKFSNLSGAFALLPFGISQQGVVGAMCCQSDGLGDEAIVGFIQQRARFTPSFALLGMPLAGSSFATGINSAGVVVGGFAPGSGSDTTAVHGFSTDILGDGLKQIDFPGKNLTTSAGGINSKGVVVGSYCSQFVACGHGVGEHGFQEEDNIFTTIDYPGARLTALNGINDAGEIVGTYTDHILSHSFFLQNGVFTTIDPPGATDASAQATNNSSVIVGTYTDAKNKSHGFEYANGMFTIIDYPKATYTTAESIDDQGEIVGIYRIYDGEFQGYLAK